MKEELICCVKDHSQDYVSPPGPHTRAPHARMGAGGHQGTRLALESDTHWMLDLWRLTSFLQISAFLGAKLSHWTVNHEHITQRQVMHFMYTFRDDFDFVQEK